MELTFPTPEPAIAALSGPLSPGVPVFAAAVKNIDKASLNNDVSETTLVFSGVDPGSGQAKFVAGKVPSPTLATFADEGVQSLPISGTYLRFVDEAGAVVFVPMQNARLYLLPDKGCTSGKGSIDAVVDASDIGGITVTLSGKTQPLASIFGPLSSGGQGSATGWQLRLNFSLVELPFDLSSVP